MTLSYAPLKIHYFRKGTKSKLPHLITILKTNLNQEMMSERVVDDVKYEERKTVGITPEHIQVD